LIERYRPRRQWRLIAPGILLLCVGASIPTLITAANKGWPAATPTVVLITSMGHLEPDGELGHELLAPCKPSKEWPAGMRRSAINKACAVLGDKPKEMRTVSFALRVLRCFRNADNLGVPTLLEYTSCSDNEIRMELIEAVIGSGLSAENTNQILLPLLDD